MSDDPNLSTVVATITIEETEEGFFYVLDGKEGVGPYPDEPAATQAAIDFFQEAMRLLVKQTLFGE